MKGEQVRILSIKLDYKKGVSEYKITSENGCCFENLMPESVKKLLSEKTYGYHQKITTIKRDKKIQQLEKTILSLAEGLEFYGDTNSWKSDDINDFLTITDQDWEAMDEFKDVLCDYVGGKTARETLEKNKEVIKSIKNKDFEKEVIKSTKCL